jgi:hypothetical protein
MFIFVVMLLIIARKTLVFYCHVKCFGMVKVAYSCHNTYRSVRQFGYNYCDDAYMSMRKVS